MIHLGLSESISWRPHNPENENMPQAIPPPEIIEIEGSTNTMRDRKESDSHEDSKRASAKSARAAISFPC